MTTWWAYVEFGPAAGENPPASVWLGLFVVPPALFDLARAQGAAGMAAMAGAAVRSLRFAAGFQRSAAVGSRAMFDIVKPQISTAADKLTHLRRFL